MDRRTCTLTRVEFKADGGDVGEFTGYLSVYGNEDSQGEVVDKGAFKRSLSHQKETGDPTPLLALHDRNSFPIGALVLSDDEHGLKVSGKLFLNIERAREAYEGMKAGVVRGLSIGFRTVKDVWVKGVRHLQEVELLEGSVVTWPANKLARIGAVKSDGSEVTADDARDVLRKAVVASMATKDTAGAFGIVALIAQTLREALLAAVPDGAQSQPLWEALYEVRATCEAIMQALYSFGKPEDVAESMAATLTGTETKARERRTLEGTALRKARAAIATLKALLDEVEDSADGGKHADPPDGHSVLELPASLVEELAKLRDFNESRRTHHA